MKRGGGLGVYHKTSLVCEYDIFSDSNISSKDLELQTLYFTRKNARNIVLFNVYRPANGALDQALMYLNDALLAIPHVDRKDIVIMGDFNVDISDKKHRDAKAMKYFASLNGLPQLIDCPTRCTLTTRKTIDLIFTNMDYIAKSGTIDLFMSDHRPVFLIKKKQKSHHPKLNFSGRTYRNYSQDIMQGKIDQI